MDSSPVGIEVGTSRNGTKYVSARDLHAALQYDTSHYSRDVTKWLSNEYGFADDVRVAELNIDYSPRVASNQGRGQFAQDYLLTLSFAKLITLDSDSPIKKEYARWLISLEKKIEDADLVTPNQVIALIEVAKVMGLISCQEAAESHHFASYLENGNPRQVWWNYRAQLLGYTTEDLRKAMLELGRNPARRKRRQMLLQTDKYKLIEDAVIDLFCALGKTPRYAINMGAIAYKLATEIKPSIWNDKGLSIDFTQGMNQELIHEVKAINKRGVLGLW